MHILHCLVMSMMKYSLLILKKKKRVRKIQRSSKYRSNSSNCRGQVSGHITKTFLVQINIASYLRSYTLSYQCTSQCFKGYPFTILFLILYITASHSLLINSRTLQIQLATTNKVSTCSSISLKPVCKA